MNETACCFTGHRKIEPQNIPALEKNLRVAIKNLIHSGVTHYLAGGALGFDTLAARAVLSLRESYPEIKLTLVLPCREQAQHWAPQDSAGYREILSRAEIVLYTSEHYFRGCFHIRNRYLVDHSGYCVYHLASTTGGTAYTVNYASQKGLVLLPV